MDVTVSTRSVVWPRMWIRSPTASGAVRRTAATERCPNQWMTVPIASAGGCISDMLGLLPAPRCLGSTLHPSATLVEGEAPSARGQELLSAPDTISGSCGPRAPASRGSRSRPLVQRELPDQRRPVKPLDEAVSGEDRVHIG